MSSSNVLWEANARESILDFESCKDNFKTILNKRVLVACSGGADSIALGLLCKIFEVEFGLAYIDHGLSIETSKSELIVKELSSKCDAPFFSKHLNMADRNLGESNVEATARDLRYSALEDLRVEHGYHVVATAHHMDDFAETYLINLIRGAGSGGASLASSREMIVRPLLECRKKDLLKLVQACSLSFFEDPMNEDNRFVRNRVRHEVIELLDDIAARDVTPLVARAAKNIQKDAEYLRKLASSYWPKDQPSTKALLELDPVLQVHAIRQWLEGQPPSSEELDRIMAVVWHEIGSTQISGNRTIWRSGAILYQDVTSHKLRANQERK